MDNIYLETYIKNLNTMIINIINNKKINLLNPDIGPTGYGC
jgi:hypothetical protein